MQRKRFSEFSKLKNSCKIPGLFGIFASFIDVSIIGKFFPYLFYISSVLAGTVLALWLIYGRNTAFNEKKMAIFTE